MSIAHAAEDAAALAKVYAPEALVFPSRADVPWVIGHNRIAKGPGGFLTAMKAQGGSLDIRFRVTERRRLGDAVVDAGFYRLVVTPASGQPNVQVGKFMTVSARQADGSWAFVGDTDTPMPASAWDAAKPLAGARFDD